MNEDICVKRNKKHRTAIRLLTVCFVIITTLLILAAKQVATKQAWIYIVVLCIFMNLLLFVLLWYYETWTLIFTRKTIKRILFFSTDTYLYSQIQRITLSYSYTERYNVRIIFLNEKSLRFRLEDENANKAVSRLKKHSSIQIRK